MATEYSIAEIVRFAVEIEKEGTLFYQKMSEKTENEEMKQLFLQLKVEEIEHQKAFEDILEGLGPDQNEYKFHLEDEYVGYLHAIIESSIFNKKEIDELVQTLNDNISIIDYALEKEHNSIKYYQGLKNLTEKKHHSTIDIMISEEEQHVEKLEGMKKKLQ